MELCNCEYSLRGKIPEYTLRKSYKSVNLEGSWNRKALPAYMLETSKVTSFDCRRISKDFGPIFLRCFSAAMRQMNARIHLYFLKVWTATFS